MSGSGQDGVDAVGRTDMRRGMNGLALQVQGQHPVSTAGKDGGDVGLDQAA